MTAPWRTWLTRLTRPLLGQPDGYVRRPPLVLVNGLAEQAESWFANVGYWRRHFDVFMPNLLVYDGDALHRRIEHDLPITVEYLIGQLHDYLESFVQTPPYHLVAASLGGKIAVEYAARYPDRIARLVLLCPSGMGDKERLPLVEGVRRHDARGIVASVFSNPDCADPRLLRYYERRFADRRWRRGLVRTVRGTMRHCVRDRLAELPQPTLFISGREDRIVDPRQAARAARLLPRGHFLSIPRCGHAPQMERPRLINRLVRRFLRSGRPRPQQAQRVLNNSPL